MADIDLIIRFVSCMSVRVVAAATIGILDGWLSAHPRLRGPVIGLILGAVGMLSMADPVRTTGGMFFDARHVVLLLSAPVGGPAATLVATIMLAGMRWSIGGHIAPVALIAIAASSTASVLWWKRVGTLRRTADAHALAALAALVPTGVCLLLLSFDRELHGASLHTIGWSVLFNALGLEMIGLLLLWHKERGESLLAFRQSEARLDSIARNARGALFRLKLGATGEPELLQISHVFPPFAENGPNGGLRIPGTPEDLAAFREVLAASSERMTPFVFERSCTAADGSTIWVRWQAAPQRQPDGSPVWDGFVSDVTDRMQVKLRMERERQQVLEHMLREFEGRVASAVRVFAASAERLRDGASTMQSAAAGSFDVTRQVSEKAHLVAAFVDDVAGKVRTLDAGMRNATTQIVEVAGKAAETTQRIELAETGIQQLSAACDQIGQIAGFIQDIAEQTNLLALNATIEAARAGDAGRGFAVVAGEVKQLAAQTTRATAEVSAKLRSITAASSNAVAAMEQVRLISRAMQELADAAKATSTGHGTVVEEISSTAAGLSGDAKLLSREMTAAAGEARSTGELASDLQELAAAIGAETHRLTAEIEEFGRRVAERAAHQGAAVVDSEARLVG